MPFKTNRQRKAFFASRNNPSQNPLPKLDPKDRKRLEQFKRTNIRVKVHLDKVEKILKSR